MLSRVTFFPFLLTPSPPYSSLSIATLTLKVAVIAPSMCFVILFSVLTWSYTDTSSHITIYAYKRMFLVV